MSPEEGRDQERVEEELDLSADEGTEDYAERLAQAEAQLEVFQAKLEEEHKARVKADEAFADERRRRRLAEFTDTARTYRFGVEVEQFAEDLMAIADFNAEVYGRLETLLRAVDEQMAAGGLFEQYAQAGGEAQTGAGAFMQAVEQKRVERFSEKPYHDGWAEAYKIVETERPDLAAQYAREG